MNEGGLARSRLVELSDEAPLLLIEAPVGYGKSTLLGQIAAATTGRVLRLHGNAPEDLLTQLAGLLGVERRELARRPAALGERLGDAALLVDDADVLGPGDKTLAFLVAERPARLLALGSRGRGGLFDAVAEHPDAACVLLAPDLAFTAEEAALLGEAVELPLTAEQVERLLLATGGWPLAVMEFLGRLSRADHRTEVVDALLRRSTVVQERVQEALRRMQPLSRSAAVQVAHLGAPPGVVVNLDIGPEALLDQMLEAGFPLARHAERHWSLPDAARVALQGHAPFDVEVARRVAARYESDGAWHEALALLSSAGELRVAVGLLARAPAGTAEALPWELLGPMARRLSDELMRAQPIALLRLLRAAELAEDPGTRDQLLEQAVAATADHADPDVPAALQAEQARDLARSGRELRGRRLATKVLEQATAPAVRARALDALGHAAVGQWTGEHIVSAARLFEESEVRWREAGEPAWQAEALLGMAEVALLRGDPRGALGLCATARSVGDPALALRALVVTAVAHLDRGAHAQAEQALDEARRRISDPDSADAARAAWITARLAARRGDTAVTVRSIVAADNGAGSWSRSREGACYLVDAADLLSQVGERVLAEDFLRRARLHPAVPRAFMGLVAGMILARTGEPEEAEERLASLRDEVLPRDRWRKELFRAWAAWRRGDPSAGRFAAQAFEAAAAIGDPRVPLESEPQVAAGLLALASRSGSPSAAGIRGDDLPLSIALLGGLDIRDGGAPVEIAGKVPNRLLKILVLEPTGVHWEVVVDQLWPGLRPERGRDRLRNVVSRVRTAAPGAVQRRGELLVLGARAEVDVFTFEALAREALGSADPARGVVAARRALAAYGGELLPEDRYEAWSQEPRERVRRLWLDILDLLADEAGQRGDVEEALRHLDMARVAAPFDDRRYVRCAELLIAQGRYGPAAKIIEEGTRQLEALGIPGSPQLADLARRLRER